jgi:hypothetical protein
MDPRITDDKVEVRNVVAAQPGWQLARFVAGFGEGEYYFDYEPIIAWDITVISGKRFGTKNDEPWQDADVHPITVEGRADAFPGPWALKLPDGTFKILGEAAPENEAAALEYFIEREAERAQNLSARRFGPRRSRFLTPVEPG